MKNENQIERLNEKLNETQRKLADTEQELKTAQKELQESKKEYDGLENDYYTLEEHATLLKANADKNGGLMGMVGNALAAAAKSLVASSPSLQGLISEYIPADALNGFINEANGGQVDEGTAGQGNKGINPLATEQAAQIDDSTIIFEWLQTLDTEQFNKVSSIIAAMRQDIRYADLIINKLQGNDKENNTE
jgi:DNA gyrase/topoisomerase IV subunit A